ncbi:MAG: enoyl-CoA hydratase [Gemmatimonadetes bacterium]|jgi:enoyl-CoA hydratase/carnithine racemase|nr:enoyl-CoA hydratase [Gemmatimonadota bacterium]MDE0964116.1 enoyl-CoA hydratase-related protein [Candidatus Latescibacterota bacterium]MBT5326885.1 enoyl-CoA hydratase [Gemmatimonadota bacterium]MBT5448164.1 enoyl-CoA hydratase [Gemmatimonadota bacterium]MBT5803473.1 enoyl-CoA hydratase [Gemmatimonadota bacterium]
MAEYEYILFAQQDHVAWITLNRPEVLNAMHPPMADELREAWTRVRDDDDIWMAVLTGSGERAFSAGSDLKWRAEQGEKVREHNRDEVVTNEALGFQRGRDCWKPLLAAVHGYAVGGGLELVLGCDIVLAADNAQFGLPEVRRGLMADGAGIHRLVRRVPYSVAMGMVLTGQFIGAEEAHRVGLVNEVTSGEELRAATERWVAQIMECAPLSLRASKEAALRGLELPLWEAVGQSFPMAEKLYASEDFIAGPEAFAEKRKPEWKGQ